MSLLLVRVSRGPLCTYPSTLCVYHVPLYILWWDGLACGPRERKSALVVAAFVNYIDTYLLHGDQPTTIDQLFCLSFVSVWLSKARMPPIMT
jgi:hypothetical protein